MDDKLLEYLQRRIAFRKDIRDRAVTGCRISKYELQKLVNDDY